MTTMHPHLPNLRGDPEGSPWRLLPGVVLVLAAAIAVLITVSFAFADLIAGRLY